MLSGLYVHTQHCSTATFGLDMKTSKTLHSSAVGMCCHVRGGVVTNNKMLPLFSQLLLTFISQRRQPA